MSELTNKQANLIKRQIKKMYNRNYIPVKTGDNSLTIGDILAAKRDIVPIIDSSEFSKDATKAVDGPKRSFNITSSSEIEFTTKISGQADFSEYFDVDEAGLIVEFQRNNEMLLKVKDIRQQSITNFVTFKKELLEKYTKGELSSKVYVVRGLVYADKYYLQFSGKNGGKVGFNIDASANVADIEAKANFELKWKKNVGLHIDAKNGGALAYRVSAVRLKKDAMPSEIHNRIIAGNSEADILDNLAFEARKALLEAHALEIVDATDEFLLEETEEIV